MGDSTRYVCRKNRQIKTVLTGGSATAKRIPTDEARSGETLKCETWRSFFRVCVCCSFARFTPFASSRFIACNLYRMEMAHLILKLFCVCVCSNGHEIPSARAHRHRWLNYSHVNYLVYRFYYRARTHYTLTKGHRKEEMAGEGGGGMVVGLGQQKLCEWKLLVAFCTYSSVATMCTSCIWIPIARWMVSSGSGCMPQIEQYREQREQFGNGNVCKTAT